MLCDRADVAQLVEQLIRNEQVVGSIPIISSSVINASEVFGGFFCVHFKLLRLKMHLTYLDNVPLCSQNLYSA